MSTIESDLWNLIPGGRQVDPTALAAAIEKQAGSDDLDFRTRLLIRDSLNALAGKWGDEEVGSWVDRSAHFSTLRAIRGEELGLAGFPSLAWRVMESITSETIFHFLRELGARIHAPAQIYIGGSAALIVPGLLSRMTDYIDVVDELPVSIRGEHELLNDLEKRYGIRLAHFQSHYLPDGWESRATSLGKFRDLEANLLDPYDVSLSKLFSNRTKDLDDLRHLGNRLDKEKLRARLLNSCTQLRNEAKLQAAAEQNWYVLYGETLPS